MAARDGRPQAGLPRQRRPRRLPQAAVTEGEEGGGRAPAGVAPRWLDEEELQTCGRARQPEPFRCALGFKSEV